MLAHEELQQSAARSLSQDELAGFLDQLHAWADLYRQRGWPAETPEYLLRGYHRLLVTIGDIERMTDIAIDRARLDRMLDVSGGDVAALAEITAAQEFICSQDHPDLAALLNLAIARDRLVQRNSNMPPALPAVWVKLGNPARAEALARSITDPSGQARALTDVAEALAETGDVDRARQVVQQAEAIARSITIPPVRYRCWRSGRRTDPAGDVEWAKAIARSITDPSHRTWALTGVAEALARPVIWTRPRPWSVSITDSPAQAGALARVAGALAETGDVDQAEAIAGSVTIPSFRYRHWRRWRRQWPGRVTWTGPVRSLSRPRPSPVPSPTHLGRNGRC